MPFGAAGDQRDFPCTRPILSVSYTSLLAEIRTAQAVASAFDFERIPRNEPYPCGWTLLRHMIREKRQMQTIQQILDIGDFVFGRLWPSATPARMPGRFMGRRFTVR